MKRVVLLVVIAVTVAGIASAIGYYSWTHRSEPASTNTTNSTNTAQPPAPDTTDTAPGNTGSSTPPPPVPLTYPVYVFFSKHPQSDDDPSKVYAVKRIAPDLGVGVYAISQLLLGPTVMEQEAGYYTTARLRSGDSTCGGRDFTLAVKGGVATLQFCRPFDHIGIMSDGQAESELKATLLQFAKVNKVVILNQSGDCEFNLSGLNLCK